MSSIPDVLRAVAPRANPAFLAASSSLGAIMAGHGFDTVDAQAELIAQTAHECAGYTVFQENLNYSAQRLVQVWPKRFPSIADAQPYAKNPKALAIKVYGSRGGNRAGTEDGWNYRGSGPLQHTFLPEFDRVQKRTGLPVVAKPDMLRDPAHAEAMWQAACTYFVDRGALAPAKAGNTEAVTLRVNGGKNGLADRKLLKQRAIAVLHGTPLPAGRTTVEQADDAKRKAKQAAGTAATAAPTSSGTSKGGADTDWSTAIAIGLIVLVVGLAIAGFFWRRHQRKQAEVETMQLQGIEARLALSEG